MKINSSLFYSLLAIPILIGGCSDKYPSSEGKTPPYILKTECKFAIVEELSRSSISSPKAKGLPDTWVSASISLGDASITVSNCEVIENTEHLPIYED